MDLIKYQDIRNLPELPYTRAVGPKAERALELTAGSGNTRFMDRMILSLHRLSPMACMRHIMAQVDEIDMALNNNRLKYYWSAFKILLLWPLHWVPVLNVLYEVSFVNFRKSKKYIRRAIIRKEKFLKDYDEIESQFGELTEDKLDMEDPVFQTCRLFIQALAEKYEGGVKSGDYLYAWEIGTITFPELKMEIDLFCYEFDEAEQQLVLRMYDMNELVDFVKRMGEKYGVQARDKKVIY